MPEIGQDLALAHEALGQHIRVGPRPDQLERGEAAELLVVALGEEHDAHAAASQLAHDAPRPDAVAGLAGLLDE